jgi:hypothetical protein
MGRTAITVLIGLVLVGSSGLPARAQSPGYKISDYTFNAGGHPHQGTVMSSASYRITLDALGDSVAGIGLAQGPYHMDGSFGAGYPPPGEVHGLIFADKQTLEWSPEMSAGDYNLYRDSMSVLSGLGYGMCLQQDLTGATTTDGDTPSSGDGYFYLVTVENRLDEEGTKGFRSNGDQRQGNVCP